MRLLIILVASLGLAWAADLDKVYTSSSVLTDAIKGMLSSSSMILRETFTMNFQYVPGLGFVILASDSISGKKQEEIIQQLKTVVPALASTIQGLDADDWVMVAYVDRTIRKFEVTVRIKPNKPNTLEVFVNGTKQ